MALSHLLDGGGVYEFLIFGMSLDVGGDKRASRQDPKPVFTRVVERERRELAAESMPFEFCRHFRVDEGDAVVLYPVRQRGSSVASAYFKPPATLIVRNRHLLDFDIHLLASQLSMHHDDSATQCDSFASSSAIRGRPDVPEQRVQAFRHRRMIASRNPVYGRPASMAVWTTAITSSASAPTIVMLHEDASVHVASLDAGTDVTHEVGGGRGIYA